MSEGTPQREQLVNELVLRGIITTPAVKDAFRAVPREHFVPEFARQTPLSEVYKDQAIPTKIDRAGRSLSSSSEPGIMALMLECLQLQRGQRVLEIGTGTGYNAALLSTIVGPSGSVASVEVDPELADQARERLHENGFNVTVVHGDGRLGYDSQAPYDRIIATASSLTVPREWVMQLADSGLIVVPLSLSTGLIFPQVVVTFVKRGSHVESVKVIGGGFMALRRPADESVLTSPTVTALDSTGDTTRVLAELTGASLASLDTSARSALLRVALSDSRRSSLSFHAVGRERYNLFAFLAIAAPANRLLSYSRNDGLRPVAGISSMGIFDLEPLSLAVLAGDTDSISGIEVFGSEVASSRLLDLVTEWRELGQPGVENFSTTVDYEVDYEPEHGLKPDWRIRQYDDGSKVSFSWIQKG
jgi:protein-L-isoaspartate(D-aspartate) O-methyltransferase